MSSPERPDDRGEALFIADFHPRFGAWLARHHTSGYDAVAGRARFLIWLGTHADDSANDDDDRALRGYLARAVQLPRLSAEEETELATRIAAGRRAEDELAEDGDVLTAEARAGLRQLAGDGSRAGNRLLEANLHLVVAIAERFTGRGTPFPDLVQAGNLGLTRAIEKYNPTRGYRFATFATWWIRQAIARAVGGPPRATPIPEPEPGTIDELTLTERWMLQLLGREPTPEELAAQLDLRPAAAPWSPPS